MSNSRGEERRCCSDIPSSQAVHVIFRSCPWSGTAQAATLRAGTSSRVRPEPKRAEACVARCDFSPTRTSRGYTLPVQRGRPCEGGTPTALEHSGFTKPTAHTRPCALLVCECASSPSPSSACVCVCLCLCVCARASSPNRIPRLRVCVCECVCVCARVL